MFKYAVRSRYGYGRPTVKVVTVLAVCSESHTENTTAPCGQNVQFLNVRTRSTPTTLLGFLNLTPKGNCTFWCQIALSKYFCMFQSRKTVFIFISEYFLN
jgi:hypothetical protein